MRQSGSRWQRVQEVVGQFITESGMASVQVNGGAAVSAIVDEDPERIRHSVPEDIYDSLRGRPALFHFSADVAVKANDVLTWDGQQWTVQPVRVVAAGGLKLEQIVLATAGAVR